MNLDGEPSEKSAPALLAAHEDVRELVRLIQCAQCSRPWTIPFTLPCGNSLCRQCLPEAHERENITYPDLPGRRQAFLCPFEKCGEEHPVSDCSVDVVLTKVMESIAEIITKHSSLVDTAPADLEKSTHSSEPLTDYVGDHAVPGGRLITTYKLAARGMLDRNANLSYPGSGATSEEDRAMDAIVLRDMLESIQKEVDCQVCYNLMLDPVTTFCGHTLCRKCLARVLDHSLHCPVCRRQLFIPPSLSRQFSNKALSGLLDSLCPEAIAAREEVVAAEERGGDGDRNVPLFVCTLGFPRQPTFLRIYEPRYRLMLRRCMEGDRQFGMLMYNHYREPQGTLGNVHFYHYGIMLSIIQAQLLPDGTSLIETRGTHRFRVISHGTHDGYAVGDVERLDDVDLAEEERIEAEETSASPPEGEEDMESEISRMSTQDLFTVGKTFIEQNQARSASWLQQQVLDIHGQPPDEAAFFPYWFASVLPINDDEKYKLLATRTVRERLKITATWIRRIESQRW